MRSIFGKMVMFLLVGNTLLTFVLPGFSWAEIKKIKLSVHGMT